MAAGRLWTPFAWLLCVQVLLTALARPGGSQLTITIKPCNPGKEPQPLMMQQQQPPTAQQRPSVNLLPAQQSLQALASGLVQPWPGMTPEQAWAATLLVSLWDGGPGLLGRKGGRGHR